jgi:hypothetical protein
MTENQVEQIKAIEYWQNSRAMHPLTCGLHHDLKSMIKDGKVILGCLLCDYFQEEIPKIVFEAYEKKSFDKMKEFLGV